jgi:hypothetical protein
MIDMILKIVPLVISLLALVVSIAVAWSNRKSLHVEIYNNVEVVKDGSIFFIDDDEIPQPYGDCLITTIEVVNPSPKDIAFFDLRAFYPETNMNLQLLTKRTILNNHRDKTLWRAIESPESKETLMEIIIPDTNYGIFKANSFTRFHIVMFPKSDAKNMLLSFKVAMKAKAKDQFAITGRKKFKFYGIAYDINSWSESSQLSQQSEQELT